MSALSLAIQNEVACITLERGDAGNPFDVHFCAELLAAIRGCQEKGSAARAILIRSSGKNFSFGGDLRWLASHGDRMHEAAREPVAMLNEAILALSAGEAPVVVAASGMVAGGAVGLASSADFLIAADNARFYAAFAGIGLSCDTGCSYFLPRLVGLRRATDFLMLNEMWDAETAQRAGLVSRRVALDALEDEARALAEKLASGPTVGLGQMRRLLRANLPLEAQLSLEADGIARSAQTRDMPNAVRSLLAKEAAVFEGA